MVDVVSCQQFNDKYDYGVSSSFNLNRVLYRLVGGGGEEEVGDGVSEEQTFFSPKIS